MDLEYMMGLINKAHNDDARRAGVRTLGWLRESLAILPPETLIALETPSGSEMRSPGALMSYRGYYDRLAITPNADIDRDETRLIRYEGGPETIRMRYEDAYNPGHPEVQIAAPCTAAEMIKALDLADGEKFEGYKGGQYLMDEHTFLHVAEYGSTGRYVSGLRLIESGEYIVIVTEQEEF